MAVLQHDRYELFAQNLAVGMTQRDAYRAAFPDCVNATDKTVDETACKLLKKRPEIRARKEELQRQASSKTVMSIVERKEWLTRLVLNPGEDRAHQLKAVDTLNKMDGAYIDNVQINANVNQNPFAGMTTDELKKMVNND